MCTSKGPYLYFPPSDLTSSPPSLPSVTPSAHVPANFFHQYRAGGSQAFNWGAAVFNYGYVKGVNGGREGEIGEGLNVIGKGTEEKSKEGKEKLRKQRTVKGKKVKISMQKWAHKVIGETGTQVESDEVGKWRRGRM